MTSTRRFAIAVSISTLACVTAPDDLQDRAAAQSRQRAPEAFACAPNDLTAYTGVVVSYQRDAGRTTLRIRTDWDTNEAVTVKHPDAADPAAFFRYAGRPFAATDWERIESSPGVVRPNTRATAWVCSDGKVLIDWAVPKEI